MKKYKLEILTPAWKEINEIANYHLYSVGVASSRKITTSILNALERLERFPFLCAYVPDQTLKIQGYRMLVCGKYICIYRVIGEIVYIYHIAPGATDYPKLFNK